VSRESEGATSMALESIREKCDLLQITLSELRQRVEEHLGLVEGGARSPTNPVSRAPGAVGSLGIQDAILAAAQRLRDAFENGPPPEPTPDRNVERGVAEYQGRRFYGEHADDLAELNYLRAWKRWAESQLLELQALKLILRGPQPRDRDITEHSPERHARRPPHPRGSSDVGPGWQNERLFPRSHSGACVAEIHVARLDWRPSYASPTGVACL
jgi:hypothetical protein